MCVQRVREDKKEWVGGREREKLSESKTLENLTQKSCFPTRLEGTKTFTVGLPHALLNDALCVCPRSKQPLQFQSFSTPDKY